MTTRRMRWALGLIFTVGLMLLGAGCVSYHGAVGVHYGAHSSATSFVYGSSFYLGDGRFQVLYRPSGYGSDYYFRTRALGPSRYCNGFCYARRGHHYHHRNCGHLGRYASRYGTRASVLIRQYGPR